MTDRTINTSIDALQMIYKQTAKKLEKEKDLNKQQILKRQLEAFKAAELELYEKQMNHE